MHHIATHAVYDQHPPPINITNNIITIILLILMHASMYLVYIQSAEWLDFKGDLRGFQALADVPILYSRQELQLVDDGVSVIEAKSMTGTDESV